MCSYVARYFFRRGLYPVSGGGGGGGGASHGKSTKQNASIKAFQDKFQIFGGGGAIAPIDPPGDVPACVFLID